MSEEQREYSTAMRCVDCCNHRDTNICRMCNDMHLFFPRVRVMAQCTEKPCGFCEHDRTGEAGECVHCDDSNSRFKPVGVDTIQKNNHDVDVDEIVGITNTQWLIRDECQRIMDKLLDKNRKYGDSAINPVRVFSKADPAEQINVRLDDKISRIMSGQVDDDEDVEFDLIGYLILRRVQRRAK